VKVPFGLLSVLLLVVALVGVAHADPVDPWPAEAAAAASLADEAACLDHAGSGHPAGPCDGALCASVIVSSGAAPVPTAVRVGHDPHQGAHPPGRDPWLEDRPPIAG
jgi:hypothetical protein